MFKNWWDGDDFLEEWIFVLVFLSECYKDLSKQRIKRKQSCTYFILNFLFVNLGMNIPM